MSLATALQKATKAVAGKLGKAVTYNRHTRGAYDPSTGKTATDTSAAESITAIVSAYSTGEIRGTIEMGDLKVDVAATDAGLTAAPVLADTLTIDGVIWTIQAIQPVYVQDSAVSYTLQVRR